MLRQEELCVAYPVLRDDGLLGGQERFTVARVSLVSFQTVGRKTGVVVQVSEHVYTPPEWLCSYSRIETKISFMDSPFADHSNDGWTL